MSAENSNRNAADPPDVMSLQTRTYIGLAGALSTIMTGLGHLFLGNYGSAILYMLPMVMLVFWGHPLGLILALFLHIANVIHAISSAEAACDRLGNNKSLL